MFQYSFAKSLNFNFGLDIKFNTDFYKRNFKDQTSRDIELGKFKIEFSEYKKDGINRLLLRIIEKYFSNFTIFNFKFFNESNFCLETHNGVFNDTNYFRGYWQNHKYFDKIKSEIKNDFSLDHNIKNLDKLHFDKIINSNSVCIHVRRTDFLNSPFDVVDKKYYMRSFKNITNRFKNLEFFIFSDDISWCKKNLSFIKNANYCNYNMLNDFHLMSLCKHFIIPNSTFSWWAAYLSTHSKKHVYIPKKWHKYDLSFFYDSSPENWLKIEND